ncbi:MAG: NAD(P)-binding domain-containing protein [Pseudonocardia sp.]|nr:NAD(P)-binding domain-containing protein [Pseudonocardia sp.]
MTTTDTQAVPLTAGVIGLGMIGGGVAVSLARRGRTPVVFDVRPEAADGLAGVEGCVGSVGELAGVADVVIVAVVDADQARAVIAELAPAARPAQVVVLASTVAVPVVHELAATCAEHGVSLLDCGVTPGDRAADNGLVAILGGDDYAVARARPVLEDFAKKVVHCGPLGAGMATKIARNVVTYGTWRAVHEATVLARSAGVDPTRLFEVIDTADPEGSTLLAWARRRVETEGAPGFAALSAQVAALLHKDLAAAQELAAEAGVALPLVDVTQARGDDTLGAV